MEATQPEPRKNPSDRPGEHLRLPPKYQNQTNAILRAAGERAKSINTTTGYSRTYNRHSRS